MWLAIASIVLAVVSPFGFPLDVLGTLGLATGIHLWVYDRAVFTASSDGRWRRSAPWSISARRGFVAELVAVHLVVWVATLLLLMMLSFGEGEPAHGRLTYLGILACPVVTVCLCGFAVRLWAFRDRVSYIIPLLALIPLVILPFLL